MRKIIFSVIIVFLVIIAIVILTRGINILGFKVPGMIQINEKDNVIDSENEKLNGLIDVTFTGSLARLNESAEILKKTKSEFEESASSARNKSYLQTDKFEIEYLFTKLGNYAKDEKVQIKIEVSDSSMKGLYDLKFYVAGKYLKVKDFIYDVENDSILEFRIEDFNMVSVEDDNVQGSFNCKEISINIERIDVQAQENENKEQNTTNNNEANANTQAQNTTDATNTTNNENANNTTNSNG